MNKLEFIENYIESRLGSNNIASIQDLKQTMLHNYIKVMNMLDSKHIAYTLEIKEGWGIIYVFNIGDKKVFTNHIRKGELEVYYYSQDYSCKACRKRI